MSSLLHRVWWLSEEERSGLRLFNVEFVQVLFSFITLQPSWQRPWAVISGPYLNERGESQNSTMRTQKLESPVESDKKQLKKFDDKIYFKGCFPQKVILLLCVRTV